MGENASTVSLEVIQSDDPYVFNLTHEGEYVGTVACDSENLTSKAPWGWRLIRSDGAHDTPLTGTSASIEGAVADAGLAFWRTLRKPSGGRS